MSPLKAAALAAIIFAGVDGWLRSSAPEPARALVAAAPTALALRGAASDSSASGKETAPVCSQVNASWRVVSQGLIPQPEGVPAAHASTLVALPAQHRLAPHQTVAAFWFAGQRESAPDVQIAMSLWDADHQKWGAPQWVVSRETLRQALGVQIRRLGNPVAWVDAQGRVHLFVVATGLGGWAASRVVHLIERPALKTNESQTQESAVAASIQFDVERILPLMPSVPMFNTSVLVRALPLALQDGGALLPVYFEIGRKYPIAVRLDAHGKMQSWVRMSERTDVLQPSVVPLSETQWLAFLRTGGERAHVGMTMTQDAGVHWQDIPDDSLGNPDSSVAALRVNDQMWLVHNPKDKGRQVLELSRATLPQAATNTQPMPSFAWQTQTIAQDQPGDEYSYPSMMLSQSSDHVPEVWISYTHLRQSIAYQRWQLQCTRRAGGRP